jgi:hypothetical protein
MVLIGSTVEINLLIFSPYYIIILSNKKYSLDNLMPVSYLNNEMIALTLKLNVTHYSIAKNYDHPNNNQVSSIHFFTGDIPDEKNCFPECAYFIPSMHSNRFGALSGFSVINRPNGLDTKLIEYTVSNRYISTAVIIEDQSEKYQALYLNNLLISDDVDLPKIHDDSFWLAVKKKYNVDKPKTIQFTDIDQKRFNRHNTFEKTLSLYDDKSLYYKAIPF